MTTSNSGEKEMATSITGYITREKAIEILSQAAYDHSMTLDQDFYNALKLAIHALQMVLQAHHDATRPKK
jgi:hypothetical protein